MLAFARLKASYIEGYTQIEIPDDLISNMNKEYSIVFISYDHTISCHILQNLTSEFRLFPLKQFNKRLLRQHFLSR